MFLEAHFCRRHSIRLALAAILTLAAVPTLRADDNLRKELGALANQIKALLDKEKQDTIAVGEFTGPSHLPGSGGSIKMILTEELKKKGVTVKAGARNFEVKGDYRDYVDPRTDDGQGGKLMGVKITARVFDSNGDQVVSYPIPVRVVHGNTETMVVMGVTADIGPSGDGHSRNQKIQDSIYKPTSSGNKNGPVIIGSRIAASASSPYAVEIRVKQPDGQYAPRRPVLQNGLVFVPLKRDEAYAVAVYNQSHLDAGVQLAIDGLSVFAFSEQRNKDGQPFTRIICPRGESQVEGWFINDKKTDEFEIVPKEKCAASQFQGKGNVGTITVAFGAAWPKGQRPADEPTSRSSEDLGTGRGKRIDKHYDVVEREYGPVRAVVSIRYTK